MIEIKNLVKRYGNKFAVDDISFHVDEGEVVGFLGPNGAGKSTTMNILTGYLSSTSGTASINGIDILEDPLSAKKLIGFLPEQPPLYMDMTVDEYLNFVFRLKGCKLNRVRHIGEICDVVKINDVRSRLISHLSKGYKQRVGIAQALIGNPKIIIFDEPTVGLDPKQIIEIRNLIRTLGSDHTIILSTHILPEVQAVCDRIIIINAGKIVADEQTENITRVVEDNRRYKVKVVGAQREVLSLLKNKQGITYAEALGERDGDAFTYMVESAPGVDIRKTLFYTLAEKDFPLVGLESMGMNLEDIFIKLIDKEDSSMKSQKIRKNSAESKFADAAMARAKESQTRIELSDDNTVIVKDEADKQSDEKDDGGEGK